MSPEEHRRIKELFQQAEELPAAEREAFLAGVFGASEETLEEVRRLLRLAGETPESFLAPTGDGSARSPFADGRMTTGRHLGPYEVLAPIASGAMGEVWRARDTRLEREVAVKVLPPEVSLDPDRRARFEREARAVAALSHPNILTLFDFGRSGGVTYAVSELLDGETLRERLRRGVPSMSDAIDYAAQVARALAATHEKGIVHRDLKPDNVFVTADGPVKLLDFGIASSRRLEDGIGGDTGPGTVIGTPGYMSPEQARGQATDGRSDIFSLGCVLYEMLAGRRAFDGETGTETLAAVLRDEPPPLLLAGGDAAPPALRRVVQRCLEKNPDERFQSARDLAVDLESLEDPGRQQPDAARLGSVARRWRLAGAAGIVVAVLTAVVWTARPGRAPSSAPGVDAPAAGSSRLMLAVLPFESIGGDPVQQRFADGMTEEMITVLGRASPERLGVIARTSSMQFKGQTTSVEAVGRTFGVGYLVEGSVRREGDQVRIAAKLIQVKDQAQLWSDSFDGRLSDILALQTEVARRIGGALSVELSPRFATAGRARATDPRAYDAYLAGRASFYRATEQGWRKAIDHYREAVTLDPDFALAHAAVASGYAAWALWGTTPPADALAHARDALRRAHGLEPDLAELHATLAVVSMFLEWKWDAAEREFLRAITLNPSDGEVYHWYAHHLFLMGRPAEAVNAMNEARRFDPLSAFHDGCLGGHYVATGDLDRAEALLRSALGHAPESPLAHHFLGWLHERKGRIDYAITSWEEAVRISDIPNLRATLGYGYARAGRLADARRVRDELDRRSHREYVSAMDRAKFFAGVGDRDAAFQWLEKAFRNRDPWFAAVKLEPGFDTIRDDPRFAALQRRIGVTP